MTDPNSSSYPDPSLHLHAALTTSDPHFHYMSIPLHQKSKDVPHQSHIPRRRWSSWRRSARHCRAPDPRPWHRRDGEHSEQHGQGARPDG